MTLFLNRITKQSSKKSGFGITEIIVGLAIAGIFGGIVVAALQKQARERRVAEAKVSMQLLHNRAQQAVKRFMAYEMDTFIDNNSARKDCFEAKGNNCGALVFPPSPIFLEVGGVPPAIGSRKAELNLMMNGNYFYSGRPCNIPACPIRVRTTWNFTCQSMSCTQATFTTTVEVNNANAADSDERSLFAGLSSLRSEAIYNKTKRIGLVKNWSATCSVPTVANLTSQVLDCDDTAPSPDNINEVFDSNVGFNYLNGDLNLAAGGATGFVYGNIGGPVPDPCPTCTRAVMTNNGLECKPSVLCTNPGWVVRGCKCCHPSIPGGGDGWGPWSACSAPCSPPAGTQTRSCLYPKSKYCDSVCDDGQTQTRPCSGKPYASAPWSGWSGCNVKCGNGQQSRSCVQPSQNYCGSPCSSGDTQYQNCKMPKCEESKSTTLRFGPSTSSASTSLSCSSGYSLDEAGYKGTKEPCSVSKGSSSATLTCRKSNRGNCLDQGGVCDAKLSIKCSR